VSYATPADLRHYFLLFLLLVLVNVDWIPLKLRS
jgi:hypothetical protein